MKNLSAEQQTKIIREIQAELKYLWKRCDFQNYCEFSQKLLKTPETYLQKSQKQSQKSTSNVCYFLNNINIDFQLPQKITKPESDKKNEDRKRQLAQKQAGMKLLSMVKGAWNYYFRMLKGYYTTKIKGQASPIFNDQTLKMAKQTIQNMLKELRESKYHWFNYTTQGLQDMERERRELEQQKTFVKLLSDMLKNQSQKVLRSRTKTSQNKAGEKQKKNEVQVQQPGKPVVNEGAIQRKPQKDIAQVIDISSYFQKRKKSLLQPSKPLTDPISQCQSRRQFNAAVLRYCMISQQE